MQEKILFEEQQRFTQWWIWAMLLGTIAFAIWSVSIVNFRQNLLLVFFAAVLPIVAFIFWLLAVRLDTKITSESISVRFRFIPFAHKKILWSEVNSAEVIVYNPWETGFGLRIGFDGGIVYNTHGRNGLQIITKEGKKFLLGTQRPDELKKILADIIRSSEN